jgi:hypothetical protein
MSGRGKPRPYDKTVYEAIAQELTSGAPLTYGDPEAHERIARAVVRAVQAGSAPHTQIAGRLNKFGVPNVRGALGKWAWPDVVIALEDGMRLEREDRAKAEPRPASPTLAEIEKLHADADAAEAAGLAPRAPPTQDGLPPQSMTFYEENYKREWR